MRAVVQRVTRSQVLVDGEVAGEINKGLMVLLELRKEIRCRWDYMAEKLQDSVSLRMPAENEPLLV